MYEVELKLRADHGPVRARLADAGAERTGTVTQRDTYYDAPHRSFAETDEALRVRRETRRSAPSGTVRRGEWDAAAAETTRLTYKGPLVEAASKTREEFETTVVDGEELAGVLGGLGFEAAYTVEKERERFDLDGYTVSLDSVTDLGEFVEVEREAVEADIETVREGAVAVVRDLGLDPDDQIRSSYLGMLVEATE
jgi:adenylate cyclase class 2